MDNKTPSSKLTNIAAIKLFFKGDNLPYRLYNILGGRAISKKELDAELLPKIEAKIIENLKFHDEGVAKLAQDITKKIIMDIEKETEAFKDGHKITRAKCEGFISPDKIKNHLDDFSNEIDKVYREYGGIHSFQSIKKDVSTLVKSSFRDSVTEIYIHKGIAGVGSRINTASSKVLDRIRG